MTDANHDGGWSFGRPQLAFDILVLIRQNWPKRSPFDVAIEIASSHYDKEFAALTNDELREVRAVLRKLVCWGDHPSGQKQKDPKEGAAERFIRRELAKRGAVDVAVSAPDPEVPA